jgi:hypothetical protein
MKRVYFNRNAGEDFIDIPDNEDPHMHVGAHLITRVVRIPENKMVKWSARDQQELNDLQERKAAFDRVHRRRVEEVVVRVFSHLPSDRHPVIIETLINRADEIRDALEPYDSGVRQKSSEG